MIDKVNKLILPEEFFAQGGIQFNFKCYRGTSCSLNECITN